ncbi:MAG: hypothetical protein ACP5TL_00625 [Candidatus Micrarchaeia archaeon]
MNIRLLLAKMFGSKSRFYGPAISVLLLLSFVSVANATATSNAVNAICSVYNGVHAVIFILGLVLMILGGAVYAGAHLLPGATKGTVQGYAMGMLIGGVIGVMIALASPYILQVITGNANIAKACTSS